VADGYCRGVPPVDRYRNIKSVVIDIVMSEMFSATATALSISLIMAGGPSY